jgi:hypothetical protein
VDDVFFDKFNNCFLIDQLISDNFNIFSEVIHSYKDIVLSF